MVSWKKSLLPPSPFGHWTRWSVLICLLWCTCAGALGKSGAIRDLRFTQWGPKDGAPWKDVGATFTFDIAPTFFQTPWFIGLCVVAAVLALWLVLQWRVRQIASRMRARHADRSAERERIARELHDTLLQGTQG